MRKLVIFIFLISFLSKVSLSQSVVIFNDNFSDPSNWTMIDVANGGNQNWVIDTNGPIGPYSGTMGVINSTTNSDGFALYDSDGLNTLGTGSQNAYLIYNMF